MGFAQESGYTPMTIEQILTALMNELNTQYNTAYTYDVFVGTNWFKFLYSPAQRIQAGEVSISEVFQKLQQFITITNERISRPVNTAPGIVEKFAAEGYIASVKPMIEADAGKINICVDADDGIHAKALITITSYANLVSGTDDRVTVNGTAFIFQSAPVTPGDGTAQAATSNDATASSLAAQINAHATIGLIIYARAAGAKVYLTAIHGGVGGNAYTLTYTEADGNAGATVSGAVFADGAAPADDYEDTRLEIATIIKDSVTLGAPTYGSESETIVLSNGQSFDWKFHLPNRIDTLLRLTTTLSDNNQVVIKSPEEVKEDLLANIAASYRLGRNFEPQRYYSLADAPWAESILLEYSLDEGTTWLSAVFTANFNDLIETSLANVSVIEA